VNEEIISRSMWAVPLQSLFEFQARIGSSLPLFLHHSCMSPCQPNAPSYFGPSSVVPLQMCLCWGKKKPWTWVYIKGFVLHLHRPFCVESFTPSALKCQHFHFLEIVSSEEHFAMLHIRMLHKIKWYCIALVYCLSCSSGQVIF